MPMLPTLCEDHQGAGTQGMQICWRNFHRGSDSGSIVAPSMRTRTPFSNRRPRLQLWSRSPPDGASCLIKKKTKNKEKSLGSACGSLVARSEATRRTVQTFLTSRSDFRPRGVLSSSIAVARPVLFQFLFLQRHTVGIDQTRWSPSVASCCATHPEDLRGFCGSASSGSRERLLGNIVQGKCFLWEEGGVPVALSSRRRSAFCPKTRNICFDRDTPAMIPLCNAMFFPGTWSSSVASVHWTEPSVQGTPIGPSVHAMAVLDDGSAAMLGE